MKIEIKNTPSFKEGCIHQAVLEAILHLLKGGKELTLWTAAGRNEVAVATRRRLQGQAKKTKDDKLDQVIRAVAEKLLLANVPEDTKLASPRNQLRVVGTEKRANAA